MILMLSRLFQPNLARVDPILQFLLFVASTSHQEEPFRSCACYAATCPFTWIFCDLLCPQVLPVRSLPL